MEEIAVDQATLEKMEEVLSNDEFLESNKLTDENPITQLLILSMHHKDVIEFQNQVISELRNKQLIALDYLKQLEGKIRDDNINQVIDQLEQDIMPETEPPAETESPVKTAENNQEQVNDSNVEALKEYNEVEHSYNQDSNPPSASKSMTPMSKSRGVDSKIKLDPVLAKIVNGDQDLKDTHLLENPDQGYIDALKDPVTHSYIYREVRNILNEQQHTVTDYMYKLFLISINFAKIRNTKSYTVFKSLLSRVRLNS